jgi:hypothetical protein
MSLLPTSVKQLLIRISNIRLGEPPFADLRMADVIDEGGTSYSAYLSPELDKQINTKEPDIDSCAQFHVIPRDGLPIRILCLPSELERFRKALGEGTTALNLSLR